MALERNRVLIVDDDHELASLLGEELEKAGFSVDTAGNAESAFALCDEINPSMVILDVVLPEEFMRTGERADGLTVLKWLRGRGDTPVIMLSSTSLASLKVLALDMGADDYVTKPFDMRELIARVHAILRRRKATESETISFNEGVLRIDPNGRRVDVLNKPLEFTQLEFNLLLVMARRPGQVFMRSQLIDAAWSGTYQGDERVVDTHIYALRKKIEKAKGDPGTIQTVRGIGYKLNAVRD